MKRFFFAVAAMLAMTAAVRAQSLDDLNIQFHGYATQGFFYTTNNNFLNTDSSDGSAAWTEAVVNLSATPQSRLRISVQARYELLGTLSNAVSLDYAVADYKAGERFGVHFGKVKIPSYLFNEIQDIDPAYSWALLPQSVYAIADRDTVLAILGGVGYGTMDLKRAGKVDYTVTGGNLVIPANAGYFIPLRDEGILAPQGDTFMRAGGSLRWKTPLPGLMLGGSFARAGKEQIAVTAGGGALSGTFQVPPYVTPNYFAEYEKDRLLVAVEWNRLWAKYNVQFSGIPAEFVRTDRRGDYAMVSYKVTNKLTAGVYDSQYFDVQAALGPSRYQKDWALSSRYDFNEFLYAKAEQHFVQGTALNYDTADNADGLKPNTKLTILKVGVSF